MKPLWWSCVFGLICGPAAVILAEITAFQIPSSISSMKINSSAEITCSTSLTQPMGLYLNRRFHSGSVIYLNFDKGQITNTTAERFRGRIHINPDLQNREGGWRVMVQLFLLGLDDTDLYYCTWVYYDVKTFKPQTLSNNGTIFIITEKDPQEECPDTMLDTTFISLSMICVIILFIFIGALILRCKQFKKNFRPVRAAKPPRPIRPQHVCHHHHEQHYPYLVTSVNPSDFRGIL